MSPLVDRREQRRVEGSSVDGLRRAAGVVAGAGDLLGIFQQLLHAFVQGLGVQDAAPPHQSARPTQQRIRRRLDDMLGAAVVSDDGGPIGNVQLADGKSG